MVRLDRSQWVTIGTTLFLALAGVGGTILVNEWYTPDIRYEEGAYYRTGEEAITSLKLENFGHRDAESIKITAQFPKPLVKDPITNDDSYRFVKREGGKGEESVAGTVDRMVPGQVLYIYFAIQNPKGLLAAPEKPFVATLTFNGGKGKTGRPALMFVSLVSGFSFLYLSTIVIFFTRWVRRGRERVFTRAQRLLEHVQSSYAQQVQELQTELADMRRVADEIRKTSEQRVTEYERMKQEAARLKTEKDALQRQLEEQQEEGRGSKRRKQADKD